MFSRLKEAISEKASIKAGVRTTKIPPGVNIVAEFQDDQLKLNDETLSLLAASPPGRRTNNKSFPVTIVSVIGPPSSQKTFIMNSICRLIIPEAFRGKEKAGWKVFPEKSVCDRDNCFTFLRRKDAILVTIPPIFLSNSIDDGERIILLDVWSWHPSPKRYSKLVDFCIKASTVAVYVDLPREDEVIITNLCSQGHEGNCPFTA